MTVSHERFLIACLAGERGGGGSIGLLEQAIVLAATWHAQHLLPLVELVEATRLPPPPAGGLWVLEGMVDINKLRVAPASCFQFTCWRLPALDELAELLQTQQQRGYGAATGVLASRWAFAV